MTIEATDLKETIARKIAVNPSIKTPVLAETLGVSEADLLRAWPLPEIRELDPARIEDLIRSFERLGEVYVVLRNHSCTTEAFGQFGGFSQSGPYLNVMTKSLHLHIRRDRLAAGFAVARAGREPGGRSLSFQVFDERGNSTLKAFLMRRAEGQSSPLEFDTVFDALVRDFGV